MSAYTFNLKGTSHEVELGEKAHPPIPPSDSRPRHPRKIRLLGIIGELMAERLLEAAGFTAVRNLNQDTANHKDVDFTGERDGRRFLISVKARNKWERSGQLNGRYKLESKCRKIDDALQAARRRGAEFAWLTIQIDRHIYNAYFGTHADLCTLSGPGHGTGRKLNGKAVMMTEQYTPLYEVLAENERHGLPYDLISNQR